MFYAEHESQRCGSDWTVIERDLKTVRGVIRRLRAATYLKPGKWTIYQCSPETFYAPRERHAIVGVFVKG